MSIPVSQVYDFLRARFPLELCENFDNCGLLLGSPKGQVNRVLISLDITPAVIDEAASQCAELIVSHHPLFFKGNISSITDDNFNGANIHRLIKHDISAICMHTNADAANGGVNDLLAKAVGIARPENLGGGDSGAIGRFGALNRGFSLDDYAALVKNALNANGLRLLRCCDTVKTVAVGGGACGGMLELAVKRGADTFVTADVKHSHFKQAEFFGINLIDAGHFATENLICGRFRELIASEFPQLDVQISRENRDLVEFI